MRLSEKIKHFRELNNLTQAQFAERAGLSNGYISQLEADRSRNTGRPITPTLTALNKLAKAMNTTVDVLVSELDDIPFEYAPDRTTVDVSSKELELLEALRVATPETREIIFRILERQ